MTESNMPYEAVDVVEGVRDGVIFKYTAVVSVGAHLRHKIFWMSKDRPATLKQRAEKWAEQQRMELRAIYADSIERAAIVRQTQRLEEDRKDEEKKQRSAVRLQRLSRGIHHALAYYGRGRAGYWDGYVNVYGNITDGDA